MTLSANSGTPGVFTGAEFERKLQDIAGLGEQGRTRTGQQKAILVGRVAYADMAECVEHALVGKHAARQRELVAVLIEAIGHGLFRSLSPGSKAETRMLAKSPPCCRPTEKIWLPDLLFGPNTPDYPPQVERHRMN